MGEKSPEEGGGNEAARSARLKKEREEAEAARKAEARKPMQVTGKSDRRMLAESAQPYRSKRTQEFITNQKRVEQAQRSIEELTARRDDTRNPITRMNLDNQIKELKAGGTPVTTTFASGGSRAGEVLTVGVVRDGTFSGRQSFDPSTGATRMNPATGTYTTRYGTRGGSATSGGTEPAAAPSTSTQMADMPTVLPQSASDARAIRRAQISGSAGGGKSRIFLGKK